MYHALLTNRYLTTRVIPFIAVAAVALCTALVIIVVSVMSGFVDMVRDAGKTLMGDVIISYPIRGIPHYERLIAEIVAIPEAAAATPVVDSWGLLKMPYDETEVVQVWGIEPSTFHDVTGYYDSLYWRPVDDDAWLNALENAARERWEDLNRLASFDQSEILSQTSDPVEAALLELSTKENWSTILDLPRDQWRDELPGLVGEWWGTLVAAEPLLRDHADDPLNMDKVFAQGSTMNVGGENGEAIVTGIHVSQGNERRRDGTYKVRVQGRWWLPQFEVTLTMLPVADGNTISDPRSRVFPVANEAQFGVYQIDDKRVLIPIETAQWMLELDEAQITDPSGAIDPATGEPRIIGTASARATLILISAVDGVTPITLRDRVAEVYDTLRRTLRTEGAVESLPDLDFGATVKTWEEQNAQIIGPVEKERNLMRILFSIIYFVCAGLVLVIFWAIVYEKTRDIGILRSIGASRTGILWIFVRYGLVVGVFGSIVGLGLAWLVVRNINHIHNALGEPFPKWMWIAMSIAGVVSLITTIWLFTREHILPVVVMCLVTITLAGLAIAMSMHQGFLVWDPKVYYFTEIPNEVDMVSAAITMVGAVVFSIIGALIPAARAGDINPVDALRYG